MRNRFDRQLEELNNGLIKMGSLIEKAIEMAITGMSNQDVELAKNAIAFDNEIDEQEKEIENLCLKLLLQQQPVARDLRQISAALKMITDMERIGDQADDIADIIMSMNGRAAEHDDLMRQMARSVIEMVNNSVDAFVKKDTELAKAVIKSDDTVDTYFDEVKEHLIDKIHKNPRDGEYALDLLMIAKYFERIGDHAVNVAEWVIFSVTGVHNGNDI